MSASLPAAASPGPTGPPASSLSSRAGPRVSHDNARRPRFPFPERGPSSRFPPLPSSSPPSYSWSSASSLRPPSAFTGEAGSPAAQLHVNYGPGSSVDSGGTTAYGGGTRGRDQGYPPRRAVFPHPQQPWETPRPYGRCEEKGRRPRKDPVRSIWGGGAGASSPVVQPTFDSSLPEEGPRSFARFLHRDGEPPPSALRVPSFHLLPDVSTAAPSSLPS